MRHSRLEWVGCASLFCVISTIVDGHQLSSIQFKLDWCYNFK